MPDQASEISFEQRVFQQFMELFVTPEVKRRQAIGELPKPLNLNAAQIIFFPDGRAPLVRVNKEVKAVGEVRLKNGINKREGDLLEESEVEGFDKIRIDDPDLADCGHATLIRFNGTWSIAFDFRYNKKLSALHINTAKQFLDIARHCFESKAWCVFVDNLFSASELIAKALLLSMPDKNFSQKTNHKAIHSRFNRFRGLGTVQNTHIKGFNKLRTLRDSARYLQGVLVLTEMEATELLRVVDEMYEAVHKKSMY